MRKSTFVIAVALVVALCVPAVAFAALAPSPQRVHHGAVPAAAVQQNDDRPTRGGEGSAAQRGYHHPEGHQGACEAFVDADGDGVCDHCAALADAAAADDAASADDAVGRGAVSGSCPGYEDADGDGVCDNYGEGCPGAGHGCQNGAGRHGQGHGCWR